MPIFMILKTTVYQIEIRPFYNIGFLFQGITHRDVDWGNFRGA